MTARHVLWTPPPAPRRGPKPKFTLDGVTDAAIAIADAEGLDAVTMQRVAERLGTTKMALYRYVSGRADLDAVMLDRALGEPPTLAADDWRAGLRAWAATIFTRMTARPWTVELAQRPHVPGPLELRWYERGLAAMSQLPLTGGERLDVLALITGHIMAVVRLEAGAASPEADLTSGLGPILGERAEEYPLTAAAFAEAATLGERDQALGFGLERVLDGIASLAVSRAASADG